jgi:type VI secretion system protein ImpG
LINIVYQLRRKPSVIHDGHDYYVSLPFAPDGAHARPAGPGYQATREAGDEARHYGQATPPQAPQTLSAHLLCTQGRLPEGLRLGDVSEYADTSPARMSFRNIRPITPYHPPLESQRLLWRLLSHLTASHLRIVGREQLLSLLRLQVPTLRDGEIELASQRRLEGIEAMQVREERRFIRGLAVDGSVVTLDVRSDHFGGLGGTYLFGCVLDEFFAGVNALNTFSELTIRDVSRQDTLRWPAKTGRQRLL